MSFTIGNNFHIIHMTDDLRRLGLWYYDVFAVRMLVPEGHMPEEKRDASLVLIGDLCIEPLAPSFWVEGWDRMPLGRFFERHGQRFHSIAWYVDEGMAELFETLGTAGFDCRGTAGARLTGEYRDGPVFTNPKDTLTQLEFIPSPNAPGGPALLKDPRYQPGWSPFWWADYYPLQIHKASHVTVSTFDLDHALGVYLDVLQGTLLHEADNPAHASRSAYVLIGDVVVELAQPIANGPLQDDMARFHHGIYSLTFEVRDLGDAVRHLERKGVTVVRVDDETVETDADTTNGCVMSFTTLTIPNDPRPAWSDHREGPVPATLFSPPP